MRGKPCATSLASMFSMRNSWVERASHFHPLPLFELSFSFFDVASFLFVGRENERACFFVYMRVPCESSVAGSVLLLVLERLLVLCLIPDRLPVCAFLVLSLGVEVTVILQTPRRRYCVYSSRRSPSCLSSLCPLLPPPVMRAPSVQVLHLLRNVQRPGKRNTV